MTAHEHDVGSQSIDGSKPTVSHSGLLIGRHLGQLALRLMPWALIVLLWELVTLTGMFGAELVPSPIQVWSTFWKQFTTDRLWLDIYM